jgi:hypothetical protein
MLRSSFLVVLAILGPAALAEETTPPIPPAAPAHSGGLASHADATLSRVVVVDAERRQVTLFLVTDNALRLIDRKPLDGATSEVPAAHAHAAQTAPAVDAPGEDPPGVPRIENAVRTSYRVDRRDGGVQWSAGYDVPLTPARTFDEIRRLFPAEWVVKSAGFTARFMARSEMGSIEASRGTDRIVIEIRPLSNTDRTLLHVQVIPR